MTEQFKLLTSSSLVAHCFHATSHRSWEAMAVTWPTRNSEMTKPDQQSWELTPVGLSRKSAGSEALMGPGLRPGGCLFVCRAKIKLARVVVHQLEEKEAQSRLPCGHQENSLL